MMSSTEKQSISITYREHYITYLSQHDIINHHTSRHQPILIPCQGCNLHTPYHRDLRPKSLQLYLHLTKFSVHKKSYSPKIDTKHVPKNVFFPLTTYLPFGRAYNIYLHLTAL